MKPEYNRPFKVNDDLSKLKITKDQWGIEDILVFLRQEGIWVQITHHQSITAVSRRIDRGDWEYISEEMKE